jgi:hypothetical protein
MERQKGKAGEAAAKEQVTELWQGPKGAPIQVLLQGHAAEGRGAEATFQLGLCKHEEAALLQARKELAARGGVELPGDAREASEHWKDAEGYWKEYIETYPGRSGLAAARRLYGETWMMRGETKEAIRQWQDVSAPMTDLEKLASLWLAKQAGKEMTTKP